MIGNGAYRHSDSVPVLANPANDADDMAAALQRFGFEVIARKNLTREEMDEAISDFGRRAADSDAALFYYAGHGLQVKEQNYLVPVDASIDSEARVPYRTVNVNQLLEEMDNSRTNTHPVGQKQANGLGLHDMSGNVREWVSDWKGEYPATRQQNPAGPSTGSNRVGRGGRGGSWARGAGNAPTALCRFLIQVVCDP